MNSRVVFLILLITFLLGCVEHENARDILKESLEKCNTTSYEVTIVKGIAIENKSLKIQEIERGVFKENKFKVESKDGITVSNGSVVWMYSNKTGFLIITDFSNLNEKPKNVFTSLLSSLMECNLNLNVAQNTYIIDGVKDGNYITVWIDKKTLMPQKSVIRSRLYGLNITYVTEFRNLILRNVDDSEFNAAFPESKTVRITHFQRIEDAKKVLNFTVVSFHNSDFKFERASVIERESVKAIALQYINSNKCPLLVLESPQYNLSMRGEEILISNVKSIYNNNRIEFKLKNTTVNVLSNCLSKQELIDVAKSIINP